jgi:hypothetical protein
MCPNSTSLTAPTFPFPVVRASPPPPRRQVKEVLPAGGDLSSRDVPHSKLKRGRHTRTYGYVCQPGRQSLHVHSNYLKYFTVNLWEDLQGHNAWEACIF